MKSKYKVIFIDDEPLVLEGLCALIDWESYGFVIDGTYDIVEEALMTIEKNPPDFIVTDINMPVINGLELIGRIRALIPEMPICILSGYRDFNFAKEAMRLEVVDYLVKPLFDDDLLPIVEQVYSKLEAREKQEVIIDMDIGEIIDGLVNGQYPANAPVVIESLKDLVANNSRDKWQSYMFYHPRQERMDLKSLIKEEDLRDLLSAGILEGLAFLTFIEWETVITLNISMMEAFISRLIEVTISRSSSEFLLIGGSIVSSLADVRDSFEVCQTYKKLDYKGRESQYIDGELRRSYSGGKVASGQLWQELANIIKVSDLHRAKDIHKDILNLYFYAEVGFEQLQQDYIVNRGKVYDEINHLLVSVDANKVERSSMSQSKVDDLGLLSLSLMEDILLLLKRVKEANKKSGDIMDEIEAYIEQHIGESLSLKALAKIYYMHPNYLGQKMKKRWGMGFSEYIHRTRISKSLEMLEDENMSVSLIANRVGYKSYAPYLDYFKKFMKTTPAHFRASKKQGL